MTALLTCYGGHHYTMHLASDYRMGSLFAPDPEKEAAADAGRKMLDAVYPDVWERNADIVKRVEDFLIASFPYYRKGNAHHTLDALRRAVWRGNMYVVEREPEYRGGFVAPLTRERSSIWGVEDYADLPIENEPWLEEPDTSIADCNAWHDANNQAMMHAAVRAEPALFLPMFARAGWISRYGVPNLSDEFAETSTPLGDAAPFEFDETPAYGESFDIAKTPNVGEPGIWYTNPGSGQMRLYGDTGAPVVDFDFDHDHGQGIPHAHNFGLPNEDGSLNREGGVSFSLWPR
ncbi:hypothetical protein AWB65_03603 [Caballeronia humi]|uniref:Uncharacterized protein n=2 Tax=Caballeronia humi TaxID=326474 RepID=A0A158HP20_9BURK|nr:hypothetical protein AWB65_03603 [Caballeronia humi]